MRQREVLLVVIVLLAASMPALALPTPPPGPFTPHAPIVIASNSDFTAANGVVSGSGAHGDPFVISGWSISTSGVAIKITGVTALFLIQHNQLDAGTGVQISATAVVGAIVNNQFLVRGTGVLITNADARVVDNSFIGTSASAGLGKGVDLVASNSQVESNAFLYLQYAVRGDRGSPIVRCNDFHDDVLIAAITLTMTTNATIDCNIMTRCNGAIQITSTIGTVIANNSVTSCITGIRVTLAKDVTIRNNTIRGTLNAQLTLDTVSGNVTGNVIIDGHVDAVLLFRAPVLFANNTIVNNLGVGVRVQEGSMADIEANVFSRNSVGISLEQSAVAHLQANVMTNNSIGLSIPYESRQTIVNMSANFVNGVNIDGSVNASQRVFFYKEANVNISGQVRDSGFSAGFFGAISAQGQVVFYEVDTVNINATVFSHGMVGVGVVNSFNVNVNASLVLSNIIGIKAEVKPGVGTVPNCVVAVKDTNVTIPVDPVLTVGIQINGCLGIVARVNVSIVETGIKADAFAGVFLSNSTVTQTTLGLDIQGSPNMTNVSGNVVVGNRIGARFSNTIGIVNDNTFQHNVDTGVRLENGAQLTFERNNVSFNGRGLFDAEVCAGSLSCSTLKARANAFVENDGLGARVNGGSSWRGDVALGNHGDGFDLGGTVRLDGVFAAGNEQDGARIQGIFEIEESNFSWNEDDGLDLVGEGSLDDSFFTFNERAGIRMQAAAVSALHLNITRNFDGIVVGDEASALFPTVPAGSLPGLLPLLWEGNALSVASPLDLHRSSLVANERDAIRAGYGVVNATHNYFGRPMGPSVNVADTVGAFSNGVSPAVRFIPYYEDEAMTTTGPIFLL